MRVLNISHNHFKGKLYPVNFRYLRKKLNLFVENERVVLECLTKEDKVVYLVLVGALNVGKINLYFDKRIETNINGNWVKISVRSFSDNV